MNSVIEEKIINISIGKNVTANPYAEEFNLTSDKEYTVLGFAGDCIQVKNDLGVIEWYSFDYFREFAHMYI